MCGIVGGVAERNVTPILLEGLRRLEYRGYDSAGVAILDSNNHLQRVRATGKVKVLDEALRDNPIQGKTGIAHTRWATHGGVTDANAHPHVCYNSVAVVHNGIIENHEAMRDTQRQAGFVFTSETDTEVVAHQVYHHLEQSGDLLKAVQACVADLDGAFALGVVCNREPDRLVATRRGSPLVVGVGIGEHFIASDASALLPVTQKFIYLEDGDLVDLGKDYLHIYNEHGERVQRPVHISELNAEAVELGRFRHYMLKEIYEQPRALSETMEGRVNNGRLLEGAFGPDARAILSSIQSVQIVACGTSYHAGMVAKFWTESLVGISCNVEVASEFRYRPHVVQPDTLFVTISQSGETADTLAALREVPKLGYRNTLAICNVPESSLVRESDLSFLTRAGPEIGVASTKAFTTQLAALLMLVVAIGKLKGKDAAWETDLVSQLEALPGKIENALELNETIAALAEQFVDKHNTLFLGRGTQFPVALEGALKLKEISYIHAEAYPAGELKHGPLALVDNEMPVIAVAPNNALLEKLKSNLQEVRARGGELYVFTDAQVGIAEEDFVHVIPMEPMQNGDALAPVVYTVPLQLLAYHVAVLKGTDVDHPRNLAKSVTVE